MTERNEQLERQFGAMRDALEYIATRYDCDYADTPKERPTPCNCSRCTARRALDTEVEWRFVGSHPARRNGASPTALRECAIVEAFKNYMLSQGGPRTADLRLAQILGDGTGNITPRDWFVATTIIQWLVTNVGSCLLEAAGYQNDPTKVKR